MGPSIHEVAWSGERIRIRPALLRDSVGEKMKENPPTSLVRELMAEFAMLTGLSPTGKLRPRRYLWTDAFAVCNFLGHWTSSIRFIRYSAGTVKTTPDQAGSAASMSRRAQCTPRRGACGSGKR